MSPITKPVNLLRPLFVISLLIATNLSPAQATDNTSAPALNDDELAQQLVQYIEPFDSIDSVNLDGLLKRIGDARLVLLGESSHGTREFYEMRARISQALIEQKGFNIVAIEADWPDASKIDYYIREDISRPTHPNKAFTTFPRWMWVNPSFIDFTRWLTDHNHETPAAKRVRLYGIDLYNMNGAMQAVINYLNIIEPDAVKAASARYQCLSPWLKEPGSYGQAINEGKAESCAEPINDVYQYLLDNKSTFADRGQRQYFNAVQNARVVKNSEAFFRVRAKDPLQSWNLREQNMLETIQQVLEKRGPKAKIIIWGHNIHLGDSDAIGLKDQKQGEDQGQEKRINLGRLVRESYPGQSYSIGFGTDHGTVTAAPLWGKPPQKMQVPPALVGSIGHLLHKIAVNNFMLPLRDMADSDVKAALSKTRMQRAIGAAYDPADERKKHYVSVSLPGLFDEYIWFDRTHANAPLLNP